MHVKIYQHTSSKRPALFAVFDASTEWGAERADQEQQFWKLTDEVDLDRPGRTLKFNPTEAKGAIQSDGMFRFHFQPTPTALETTIAEALMRFRMKVTIPLLRDTNSEVPEILGTGTLFTHEGRYFVVTADHIFREDVDNSSSPLIDMSMVAYPSRLQKARLLTLGNHNVWRLPPPIVVDVIVLELLAPDTLQVLKMNWNFLPFSQIGDAMNDDRFLISGFKGEGAHYVGGEIQQAMLNLETDLLHDTPTVRELAPDYDIFLYLQQDAIYGNDDRRPIGSLRGLSGGPIWVSRGSPADDQLWTPGGALTIAAVQSSELKQKWSRAVHAKAVLEIVRSPKLGFQIVP